jgi:hypothetical protein
MACLSRRVTDRALIIMCTYQCPRIIIFEFSVFRGQDGDKEKALAWLVYWQLINEKSIFDILGFV